MKNETTKINLSWQICLMAILSAACVMIPDMAFANTPYVGYTYVGGGYVSSVGQVMCGVAAAFDGEVAAAVATIAVCTVGVMASVGRIQWTSALVVAVGLAILFGVAGLINFFIGAGAAGGGYCQ